MSSCRVVWAFNLRLSPDQRVVILSFCLFSSSVLPFLSVSKSLKNLSIVVYYQDVPKSKFGIADHSRCDLRFINKGTNHDQSDSTNSYQYQSNHSKSLALALWRLCRTYGTLHLRRHLRSQLGPCRRTRFRTDALGRLSELQYLSVLP